MDNLVISLFSFNETKKKKDQGRFKIKKLSLDCRESTFIFYGCVQCELELGSSK